MGCNGKVIHDARLTVEVDGLTAVRLLTPPEFQGYLGLPLSVEGPVSRPGWPKL